MNQIDTQKLYKERPPTPKVMSSTPDLPYKPKLPAQKEPALDVYHGSREYAKASKELTQKNQRRVEEGVNAFAPMLGMHPSEVRVNTNTLTYPKYLENIDHESAHHWVDNARYDLGSRALHVRDSGSTSPSAFTLPANSAPKFHKYWDKTYGDHIGFYRATLRYPMASPEALEAIEREDMLSPESLDILKTYGGDPRAILPTIAHEMGHMTPYNPWSNANIERYLRSIGVTKPLRAQQDLLNKFGVGPGRLLNEGYANYNVLKMMANTEGIVSLLPNSSAMNVALDSQTSYLEQLLLNPILRGLHRYRQAKGDPANQQRALEAAVDRVSNAVYPYGNMSGKTLSDRSWHKLYNNPGKRKSYSELVHNHLDKK